jgi:hypothetical protein
LRGKKITQALLCAFLLITLVSASSHTDQFQTQIIEQAFGKEFPQIRSCKTLSRGPKFATTEKSLIPLSQMLANIESAIEQNQPRSIVGDFHPRLKVSVTPVNESIAQMRLTYEEPIDVSILRFWAMRTPKGVPEPIGCDDGDLLVTPHFGYEVQFGALFQVMGKRDLGRLFVTFVPKDNRYYIGAWHTQQWTHLSVDPQGWYERGKKSLDNKALVSAYVELDLARKLINGRPFLVYRDETALQALIDKNINEAKWLELIQKQVPDWNITYATTAFAKDGSGLIVNAKVPAELSGNEIQAACANLARKLFDGIGFVGIDGIKCHFVLEGENPQKEGRMGGTYTTRSMIKTSSSKNK